MENIKVKIITGFRDNQYYVIDGNEAHKAYYLFMNPEERGVFKNGVALVGKSIQGIEPAWNETMGWNPTHKLDDEDWNEIHRTGVKIKMRNLLINAKKVMSLIKANPALLQSNLSAIVEKLEGMSNYKSISEKVDQKALDGEVKRLSDKVKIAE